MATSAPQIDPRDSAAIIRELRALAPYYTPEWTATAGKGVGAALLTIVAQMLEGLVLRLNEVPRNNFVEFLNTLNIQLLPKRPARAPLTFTLNADAPEGVEIPAGTQVTASPPGDGEPLVFETEKAIWATSARLAAVYSVVPGGDQVFDHSAALSGGKASELFAGQDLQEHSLYLGHKELFNVKGPVEIELTAIGLDDRLRKDWVTWEYCRGEVEKIENGQKYKDKDWVPLKSNLDTSGDSPLLTLYKEDDSEIKPVSINNIESRWIRCRVKQSQIDQVKGIQLGSIGISVKPSPKSGDKAGIPPDMAFLNDRQVDLTEPFHPFGTRPRLLDTFYVASREAFSKPGTELGIQEKPQTTLAVELCHIAIWGPGLRADYPKNTKITPTWETGASAVRYKLTGTADAQVGEFSLDSVTGLAVDQIIKISDSNKEEYLTVASITGNKVIVTLPLLYGHDIGTQVSIVTLDNTQEPAGLEEAAKKEDKCLPVDDFVIFLHAFEALAGRTLLAKIGEGATAEYQIVSISKPSTDAILTWEYWNGTGWLALPGLVDGTKRFSISGEITFRCPHDISPVTVNGQENLWIRVRITGGDYGKEEFRYDPNTGAVTSRSNFRPPLIRSLGIGYATAKVEPDACLTYNNLEYQDETTAMRDKSNITPFLAMSDDEHQGVYLGFDGHPSKGPISIFFALEEQPYSEENRPQLRWEYRRSRRTDGKAEWAQLDLPVEETGNLTQSGTIQFMGPEDFASESRLGKPSLYWVRAVDLNDSFKPSAEAQRQSTPTGRPDKTVLDVFHPIFSVPSDQRSIPPAPKVSGIHLNTAWAIQAETMSDEILGSGTSSRNLSLRTAKPSVMEEEAVWVDEFGTLSDSERRELGADKSLQTKPEADERGQVTRFWIRWHSIEDLERAEATERAYALDRASGEIRFGDGVHGLPPPIGANNIHIAYRAGGGASGNVAAGQITALRTTIPFVEGVSNPWPAGGGSDAELPEQILERGPQAIKHRDRAVTVGDYEWLAKAASRAVARVKVLPNVNDQGETETNWVIVIVVPNSSEPQPTPSPQLRQQVQTYLQQRSANMLVQPGHLLVTGPAYVEVKVTAKLIAPAIDRAPHAEIEALDRLRSFLHPLTGGPDHQGWQFGRAPNLSDFYALLESISGVDHVRELRLSLRWQKGLDGVFEEMTITEDEPMMPDLPEYALIFSGAHQITVEV